VIALRERGFADINQSVDGVCEKTRWFFLKRLASSLILSTGSTIGHRRAVDGHFICLTAAAILVDLTIATDPLHSCI